MIVDRESTPIIQTLQFDSGDVKFAKIQRRTCRHFCLFNEELRQDHLDVRRLRALMELLIDHTWSYFNKPHFVYMSMSAFELN